MSSTPAPAPSSERRTPRILVGGVGLPWRRDLDLGRLIVEALAGEPWPADVLVEDLSYSAHRVMHRLEEVRPDRLVLVAATERGDEPGTVRTYAVGGEEPDPDDVTARLGESVGGVIDLDHIIVVNRYFGTLPADTVVVEVETGDQAFGVGYSPAVERSIPAVVAAIRREVSR